MKYALGNILNGSSVRGLDADAKAYIDAVVATGVSVSNTQKAAINTFYKTAKSEGYYTNLRLVYLPIWASATANAIDLIARGSGTFVGPVIHGSGHVQGNATSTYFNTGVAPSSMSGVSPSSAYMFGLFLDVLGSAHAIGRVRNIVTQDWNILGEAAGVSSAIMSNTVGAGMLQTACTKTAIISGSRLSGTRFNSRRSTAGRSVLGSLTDANYGVVPTLNLYFMAGNFAGTATNISNTRFGSFGCGTGFSDTQDANFTLALKNLWETCTGQTIP